jgi:hypothetical protein
MASANPALASQLQNQVDAALQSGDRPKAELGLRLRAASAPKTSAPWIRLARFYLDAPPSTYKERTTPEAASDFALPASYLGYLKSVSNADQLAALRLIEEALRRAQQTNVYTAEFEDERALARAVADVGKERVALGDRSASRAASADDNTFDVEGDPEIKLNRKQAEVCIRFTSQPAAKNLGRFIAINPQITAEFGVDEDRSPSTVCIGGFAHGKRYKITLKAGLPAADQRVLASDSTLQVLIGSRPSEYGS